MHIRSSLIACFFILACTSLADHIPEPPPGRNHIAPDHKYKPGAAANAHVGNEHPHGAKGPNVKVDWAHEYERDKHVARDAKEWEGDDKTYARVGKPVSFIGKKGFGDVSDGAEDAVKDSAKQFGEGAGKENGHWARDAKDFESGKEGGRKGFDGVKGGKAHGGKIGARNAKDNMNLPKGKGSKEHGKGGWGF